MLSAGGDTSNSDLEGHVVLPGDGAGVGKKSSNPVMLDGSGSSGLAASALSFDWRWESVQTLASLIAWSSWRRLLSRELFLDDGRESGSTVASLIALSSLCKLLSRLAASSLSS